MFQARHSSCSKQGISCVPSKTSPVLQAGHLLWPTQDISRVTSRVPNKTSPVFQAKHLLCSKQDISCVPSKASPVFQAGHLLSSKKDISCVPGRTSPVFHAGHLLFSKQYISCAPITKNVHATFWRMRPIVPGLVRIMNQNPPLLGTIDRSRQKVACEFSKLQPAKKTRG